MQTHEEATWVGGGEADANPLSNGGLVGARDLVAHHRVRQHLDADLCYGCEERGGVRDAYDYINLI